MSLVDKRRLAEALKLNGKKPTVLKFAWSECLDESILFTLSLADVGDVCVPISLTDIDRLEKAFSQAPSSCGVSSALGTQTKQPLQIDASKMVSFTPASFLQNGVCSVVSMAVCQLGINPGVVSFEAHLDKLSLFPPGGNVEPFYVTEREPGMFASIILQIPVVGGHTGGKIKVKLDKESQLFDCEKDSDNKFYLTAMHNGCKQEFEPITNGWMVTLSINLVWRNVMAMADSPLPLPTLLTALNEIAEALRLWNAPIAYEPISKALDAGSSPEEIIASVLDSSLPSDLLDYSSAIVPVNPRKTSDKSNMLFFLLDGKYSISDLGFADLTGQDQLLARLLNCSQFLEIHLAIITQQVSGVLDYCDLEEEDSTSRFKIEHWINSSNTLIKLKGIEFDLRTQVVGNLQKFRNYNIHEDDEKENVIKLLGNSRSFSCHHPVLVIWPKPQTIRIYCQYGFNAVLDRMEAAVDISSNHRQELIGDLGIVLSFCRAEPVKVWRDLTTEPGKRTYRLLRLCIFLRARDEGLELLELLGTDFPLDQEENQIQDQTKKRKAVNCFYEGIRSEQVTRTIADFQNLIGGWSACCHRILALVTPVRIIDQLAHSVSLVKHLLNRSCLEGAIELMDCISFTLANLDAKLASNLKQTELEAFVDQMITMESDPKLSNPHRLSCLTTLFPRLDFHQQCRLVVDLHKESCHRLQGVPACQQTFRDLCRALSFSDLHAQGPVANVVVELLKCYIDLEDEYLVQSLTEKICTVRNQPSEPSLSNDFLETILSAPEIWELVSLSQMGKTTVANLVINHVSYIVNLVDQPLPVLTEEVNAQRYEPARHSWMLQPRQEVLRAKLSSCVHRIFRLERVKAFKNQQRVDSLSSLYCKLSLDQLCHLVLDLRELDGSLLKENTSSSALFVELCQLLIDRSKESMPQVAHEVIVEVVKSFIWLGDVLLVRSLVKQICLAGSGGSWDPADKNKLLETILSSPDSWGEMAPGSNRLVRDSSTALIGAWIVGLCRILDQVGSNTTLEKKADGLRGKIAKCVNIFIRTEKSQPRSDQPSIATFFTLLLSKLSLEKLCHLIIDLHKMDTAENVNSVLKTAPCSNVYRDLCRLLVLKDVAPIIKSFGFLVTEVWKSLLWFGDEEIFKSLSNKILEAFLPSNENPVVAKIVSSSELRQLVRSSVHGRAAFCLFLEQRIDRLKAMTKPFLSWDYPYAVVPGHPEVEAFLRSSHKSLMYSQFPTFSAACKFAIQMGGTKDGYSIRVNPEKVGKHFKCKIEKMLSRNSLMKKEVDELAEFLACLKQIDCPNNLANQQQTTSTDFKVITFKREVVSDEDEIYVVRPTKRSREEPNFPVGEIDY